MSYTLVIRILVGNELDKELIKYVKESLKFRVNEEEVKAADDNGSNVSLKDTASGEKFLAYTCRGVCTSKLGENFYWTPFDVLPIPLKIELSHIVYNKNTYIRFNNHVHPDMGTNLCLKDEVD